MDSQSLLEEKRRMLKEVLDENLHKKHLIELSIMDEFEQLKKLEISLEKMRLHVEGTQPSN